MLVPAVSTFVTKRHARLPILTHTIVDTNGDAVDITGYTGVTFLMYAADGSEKVNAAATVVDAATGEVSYSWSSADVDTGGEFVAEFDVDFGSTGHRTSPPNGTILVRIFDDLDNA